MKIQDAGNMIRCMLRKEPNVQVSDTTEDEKSAIARYKKLLHQHYFITWPKLFKL